MIVVYMLLLVFAAQLPSLPWQVQISCSKVSPHSSATYFPLLKLYPVLLGGRRVVDTLPVPSIGAWRHLYKRFPLTYHPVYWGLVFPIGMYTICTFRLAQALQMDFLYIIPRYFVFVAVTAWLITFFGLALNLLKKFKAQEIR